MKKALFDFFQKSLNQYLSLDPEAAHHVKRLSNKIVQVELLGIDLTFQLVFTDYHIALDSDNHLVANTFIKGTPLTLVRLATTSGNRKHFFENDVSIEGDIELGQQVIALFDQLEIDWEELAAQKMGDLPAHQLSRVVRNAKKWCQQTKKILLQNANEYIHEEILWFPPKEALQEFFLEVDELRSDVDRLEQRLKLFQSSINQKL